MASAMTVFPVRTRIIEPSDSLADLISQHVAEASLSLQDGDVVVVSSKVCALTEGERRHIDAVPPSQTALNLSQRTGLPAGFMEKVLQDADKVIGVLPRVLATIKNGVIIANSGADMSNAGEGNFIPLPRDPDASAARLCRQLRAKWNARVAVIVTDSVVHALRRGTTGVALGVAGMHAVVSEIGKTDLFGHSMHVTTRAVADNVCCAAQLLMGETVERIPVVVVRGAPVEIIDDGTTEAFVTTSECVIPESQCLYMGHCLRPDPDVQAELAALGVVPKKP
eukprot:m51a1_g3585 putative f420-dependent oxidoreductase (281) ;mRNA; f:1146344-1147391